MESRYHFELWSPAGQLLLDLAGRAKNRRIILSRNEAEDVTWQIDLREFERVAGKLGKTPDELLKAGQTEFRVRRGQNYLCGGRIFYRNVRITPDSADIEIRGFGWLQLFAHRYVGFGAPYSFTQKAGNVIAAEMISQSQQGVYMNDFGITIGTLPTLTGTPHDRTYENKQIKEAVKELTQLQSGPFDFEFTHDKVFNTYTSIGSDRPDVVFELPGNIRSLESPLDATRLANEVYFYGAGNGADVQLKAYDSDPNSEITYDVFQKFIQDSSISTQDNADKHVTAEVAAYGWPFEVPSIEVDGNRSPFIGDYGIGDRVNVRVRQVETLAHINGMYRIEKIDLSIDENDNEKVKLYLSL